MRTWPTREMYAIKMTFTKTFRMTFRVPRDTTSFTSRGFILLFFSPLPPFSHASIAFTGTRSLTPSFSIIDPIRGIISRSKLSEKRSHRGTVALRRIVKFRGGHVDKESPLLQSSLIKHKRVKLVLLPPSLPPPC